MKRSTLRIATLMLALTLITSCFVGGTFAKYITTADSTDTARVAKFGVDITANGAMFAKGYKLDNTISTEVEGEASVWSSNGDNLLAPGTEGALASMTLEGVPEVDVKVSYDAEVTINDKWVVDGDKYFPITVKVNDVAVVYNVDDDAATIEAAIEAAIEAYTKTYEANTDLSTKADDSLDVTWAWAFSTGDANDAKDTKLGDAAADDIANAGKLTVAIKTTVEQID